MSLYYRFFISFGFSVLVRVLVLLVKVPRFHLGLSFVSRSDLDVRVTPESEFSVLITEDVPLSLMSTKSTPVLGLNHELRSLRTFLRRIFGDGWVMDHFIFLFPCRNLSPWFGSSTGTLNRTP